MKPGFLWRLSIATSAEAEEVMMELLAEVSRASAVSFLDTETRRVTVSVYFPKKPAQLDELLANLRRSIGNIRQSGLNVAPAKISCTRIRRESWAHSWKRHFKPLEIGAALLIKPSWNRRRAHHGQATVILDPGLSFGTGQHPTTEFCLRQIAKKSFALNGRKQNLSLLDMGTGSGILAIAAAKLGFAPIHAFDFDPEAVRIAKANARKNGVSGKIEILQGDLTRMPRKSVKKYDIVCGNLISTLLLAERERIVSRLKPNGVLVLAGILKSEFGAVQKAYEKTGLKLVTSKGQKEWQSGMLAFGVISGRKKS